MDVLNLNNLLRPQEVTNEEEQQQMERERTRPREEPEHIRVRKHKTQVGSIAEQYGKDRVTISEEGQYAYKIARDIVTTQATGEERIALAKEKPEEDEKLAAAASPIFGFIKGILGL